jgi:hypothetical protein
MKHFVLSILGAMILCTFGRLATAQPAKTLHDAPSLSEKQLAAYWERFTKERDFQALMKDVNQKGFERINAKEAAWGVEGEFIDGKGNSSPFLFCVYDFYHPKSKQGQGCSMIYKRMGNKTYKAYIVFPEGEKDAQKAMANAKEWFVDAKANVQLANSFSKCFPKCVATGGKTPGLDADIVNGKVRIGGKTYTISCLGICGFSTALCTTAITAIVLATGGIGVPVAVALLVGCAGPCATCMALCAIGCS